MKKPKLLVFIVIGTIILFVSFWCYTSEPTSFPTDDQLIEEMSNSFSIVSNSVIQDTVFLDDRHVFVPFIAEHEMYELVYGSGTIVTGMRFLYRQMGIYEFGR